jgi:hypothetical protein
MMISGNTRFGKTEIAKLLCKMYPGRSVGQNTGGDLTHGSASQVQRNRAKRTDASEA